ncbi:Hsp20 family protein [bacterium]|nr:Hsp20 family protein [bacterium]
MRFSVIERDPECYIPSDIRSNLEGIWDAVVEKEANEFAPMSEIRENDNEYIVKLQLPGIEKEDINIEVEDKILTISAELKHEELQDNERMHYSNIKYGKFNKSFEFINDIDTENSKCEFKNGILRITLKKMDEKKNIKKLTIE